ncbi:leucine-rich repeat domain-containing protein [Aspergillus mulundensis]|uniref:Uncharacterized protein n=1 Tax=Aspergillus mulundensis TaxID=1810919 RepID=A0A3D8REK8_9EURO|nr:Uncharacterized protein DSM5745_07548 [Aspergillus mulundensis]RDW72376.1 Uncharacterized protein DSM5745_07548 [Aspergillus mulundensis]
MDTEPPLPPPPRIRHRSPHKPSHQPGSQSGTAARAPARVNKTTYRRLSRFDDASSQPSSDPALFSSDDIPASGLENYHATGNASGNGNGSHSRKRRYRGTWWGEMVKEKDVKRKRADFKDKRFNDSGVWMGSDDSRASGMGFLASEDAAAWGEELLGQNQDLNQDGDADGDEGMGMATGMGLGMMPARAGFAKKVEESREHQLARAVVNDCLERGLDSVDLSNAPLRTIPPNLLRPLQHLTKLPSIREPPISEEGYSSLQPFLCLFLSGNALTTLPGELFELGNTRVLSLRNNKLTEIPPAIRRLTKLQELNVAVNRLTVLPWELLWLIKKGDLKHLIIRPNEFTEIDDPATKIAHWHLSPERENEPGSENEIEAETAPESLPLKAIEYEGPAPEEAWAPIHVATSPVQRFNMDGLPIPNSPTATHSQSPPPSRVPSLREVSLLSFSRSTYFDILPDEELALFPNLALPLLLHARDVRNAGGRSCSVCHRSFVIARTEWIEWWDVSTYENGLKGPRASGERLRPVPFRRLGCSLGCLPATHQERGE